MSAIQNSLGEVVQPSPVVSLRELVSGMRVTQLIYIAAKLSIADLLKDGSKSQNGLLRRPPLHPAKKWKEEKDNQVRPRDDGKVVRKKIQKSRISLKNVNRMLT